MKLAFEQAKVLLGCYRKTDAIDPEIYVPSIACILEAYDLSVIYEATHPRTGIQATEKFKAWPPNSGELKEFCDALSARNARHAAWLTLRLSPPVEPELPRPTEAELDAQFERLGLKHLRPGSKCAKPAHVVSAEVQMARAILDRYADPKIRNAIDEEMRAAAAASRIPQRQQAAE